MTSLAIDSPTALTVLAQTADTTSSPDSSGWWFVGGSFIAVLIAVVAVACIVLFIAALVSILSSRSLTGGGKLLWIIAVFVFQFFGPLVWFLWGRDARLSRQPSYRV